MFNITGDLLFNNNAKLVIGNLKPENIIWNTTQKIMILDSADFYGITISKVSTLIGNQVTGKLSVFSYGKVILNKSLALYSISQMNSNYLSIATGVASVFVCENGDVQSWGNNWYGQLGNGTYGPTNQLTPIFIPNLTGIVSVSIGSEHVLALKKDGTIYSWGLNEYGELGNGNRIANYSPNLVVGITNAIAITAGKGRSYALLSNGTVMAWGANFDQLLGVNQNANYITTPHLVHNLTNVKAIVSGETYVYALLNTGEVMAWGNNECGLLGIGNFISQSIPILIPNLINVQQISTSINARFGQGSHPFFYASGPNCGHTSVLLNDGSVRTWGENQFGVLGNPNLSILEFQGRYNSPQVPLGFNNNVVEVECGSSVNFARLTDGSIKVWGWIGEFQQGVCNTSSNNFTYFTQPVDGPAVSNVADIILTNMDEMRLTSYKILLENGQLLSWGIGTEGDLGNGSIESSCSLVNVLSQCPISSTVWPNAVVTPKFNTQSYHNSEGISTSFINQTSNAIAGTNLNWDFGDGNTLGSNNQTVLHIYEKPGYYTVTLTATNILGSASISNIVYIIPSTAGYNPSGCISNSNFTYLNLKNNNNSNAANPQIIVNDFSISGTWVIQKGTYVKIASGVTISFGPLAKVIIEPEAVLEIDGATLTGINTQSVCGIFMWMGVEVWGDNTTQNTSKQGKLIIKNEGVIQYAHNAVVLGSHTLKRDGQGFMYRYHDIRKGGGILVANNAVFNSNGTSVVFFEYDFKNMSIINDCKFWSKRSTNNFAPLLDPYYNSANHYSILKTNNPFFSIEENGSYGQSSCYHIMAYGVNRLKIYNNLFDNAVTSFRNYNTSYYLLNNDFTNISNGISSEDYGSISKKRSIINSNFNAFYDKAIYQIGTVYDNLVGNRFNSIKEIAANSTYGIYLIGSSNFFVSDNVFTDVQNGVYTNNLPNSTGYVGYHNEGNRFINCFNSIKLEGTSYGLKLKCNDFENGFNFLGNNITISGPLANQGISANSGLSIPKLKRPAGNLFDVLASSPQRKISTNTRFSYYCFSDDFTIPIDQSGLAYIESDASTAFPQNKADACSPLSVIQNEDPEPVLDDIDLFQRKIDTLLNIKEDLELMTDNYGQTATLLELISQNDDLNPVLEDLFTASPLSETVLIELLSKHNILTENYNVCKEILLRNLPSTELVWSTIQEMKNGFETEDFFLLEQYNGDNPFYVLPMECEKNMKVLNQEKDFMINDILRFYDGVDNESLTGYLDVDIDDWTENQLELLNNLNNSNFQKELIKTHSAMNNFFEAQILLTQFDIQNDEDGQFYDLMTLHFALKENNLSYWDLTVDEIGLLNSIANYCPENINVLNARSILKMIGLEPILPCDSLVSRVSTKQVHPNEQLQSDELQIQVRPNPANASVVFDYQLPTDAKKAEIIITDMLGQQKYRTILPINKNYLFANLEQLDSGVYIYTFYVNELRSESKKLIIQK